jgi:hypothetical protein
MDCHDMPADIVVLFTEMLAAALERAGLEPTLAKPRWHTPPTLEMAGAAASGLPPVWRSRLRLRSVRGADGCVRAACPFVPYEPVPFACPS